MKMVESRFYLFVLLMLVANQLGCESSKSGTAGPESIALSLVDEPDELTRGGLAEAYEFDGFSIRPPKGFERSVLPGPFGSKAIIWITALDKENTSPLLQCSLMRLPDGEEKISLDRFHDKQMDSQTKEYEKWEISEQKRGTLAGAESVLARWNGTRRKPFSKNKLFALKCMTCSVKFGDLYIGLRTHVFEHTTGFPIELGETSIFSFRHLEV